LINYSNDPAEKLRKESNKSSKLGVGDSTLSRPSVHSLYGTEKNTSGILGQNVLNQAKNEDELLKRHKLMCAKPRRLLVKFFSTIENDEEDEGTKE
jgi:Mrp family chromosome partitioning ATPase